MIGTYLRSHLAVAFAIGWCVTGLLGGGFGGFMVGNDLTTVKKVAVPTPPKPVYSITEVTAVNGVPSQTFAGKNLNSALTGFTCSLWNRPTDSAALIACRKNGPKVAAKAVA